MSIRPLPDSVSSQIKSSAAINSLSSVVLGLVQNSLDASATSINVSVDFTRADCSVEDNGVGIPPGDFRPEGGLGKLHRSLHHTGPSVPRASALPMFGGGRPFVLRFLPMILS